MCDSATGCSALRLSHREKCLTCLHIYTLVLIAFQCPVVTPYFPLGLDVHSNSRKHMGESAKLFQVRRRVFPMEVQI